MRFFRWPSSAKRPVGDPDAWGDVLGRQPITQGPIEHGMHGVLGPRRTCLAIAALVLSFVTGAHAQQSGMVPALVYDAQTRGPVPIPSSERGLQTVVAEAWFKVSDEGLVLEGPAFDRDGNLLFCDVSGRRVLRLAPDKRLSTVVSLDQLGPGGLAVHKDGRVFIAGMVLTKGVGSIIAVEPDGSGMRTIVPPEAGYMPNDLVFDARGGFYFTDFRGASTDPKGGVYYVSPDFRTITPVLPGLAMANGVALEPERQGTVGHGVQPKSAAPGRAGGRDNGHADRHGYPLPLHRPGAGLHARRCRRQSLRGYVRAGPGPGLQQERHPHRPGAAAGPRRRPQPTIH